MDTTATEIVFDDNGVCNFCHHYDTHLVNEVFSNKDGEEKLNKLIDEIRSKKESESK